MIVAAITLLSIAIAIAPTIQASYPYSVKGVLYLNENEIAEPGVEIILVFPDGNETNTTYEYNLYGDNTNYNIGFFGHDDLTGNFIVLYKGHELVPEDNQTIDISPTQIGYLVDLHINTTGIDTEPPSKVTGLTVTDAKDGKLNLKWNPATDNIAVDYYNIYWDQDGYTSVIAKVNHPTVTYQKTGLDDGTTYTFKVSAVDTSGNEGEKSDPASGTPTATSSGGGGNTGGGGGTTGGGGGTTGGGGSTGVTADFDWEQQDDLSVKFTDKSTGDITSWLWDFGDGETSTEQNPTHTYTGTGLQIFTVTLTVSNNADTDTYSEEIQIFIGNNPPTKPLLTGNKTGTKNTNYTYTVTSTDPDNHSIKYMIDWGDGTNDTSSFLPNGTTYTTTHKWINAGKYTVKAQAIDDYDNGNGTLSESAYLTVLIDAINVDDIGYLTDDDGDGIYDTFHGNNGIETTVQKREDGRYLIDSDGDGNWDYIFDPDTNTLEEYNKPEGTADNTIWYILGIIIIIVLLVLFFFLSKHKEKKEEKPKNKK